MVPKASTARYVEDAYWAGERLNGRRVTVADVFDGYQDDANSLRSGYFIEKLFWQKIPLKGLPVTAEQVIREFFREKDSRQKYQVAVAYFYKGCFQKNIPIDGQRVTAETVARSFPQSPNCKAGLARFRARCCEDNIRLNGQQVTADSVVAGLRTAGTPLDLAFFLSHCCRNDLLIRGQPVTAEMVVDAFPDSHPGRLGRAHFMEACCTAGRPLKGQLIPPDMVLRQFQACGRKLEVARFKLACYIRSWPLNGQLLSPEEVAKGFVEANAPLELGRFKARCCLNGVFLNGERLSFKAVSDSFPNSQLGILARARFRAACCEDELLFDGQPVPPELAISDFQAAGARLPLARFLQTCCLKGLLVNGQQVSSETVAEAFLASNDVLALTYFKRACCLEGIKLNGQLISTDAVLDAFSAINARLEIARFKEDCFLNGLPVKGKVLLPQDVISSFPRNAPGKLGRAIFKSTCCLEGILLNGQPVPAQSVIDDYLAIGATLQMANFRRFCYQKRIKINGRPVLATEVISDYRKAGLLKELAHFQNTCFQQGIHDSDDAITQDTVAESFRTSGATLDLMRFREYCCLNGHQLHGAAVLPESVLAGYLGCKEEQLRIACFKARCCIDGVPLTGRPVSAEEVLRHFPTHHLGKMARAHFMEDCFLRSIEVNGRPLTAESILHDFPGTADGKLSQARFRENCCLQGLPINGRLVTPESVIQNFPDNAKGNLARAHFKGLCLIRGLSVSGQPLSTHEVLVNFPDTPEGKLGAGCFLERCLLKGINLSGKPVTTEAVFEMLDTPEGTLTKACFQAMCCLRKLPLHGKLVTADEVVAAYPDNREGQKQLVQFKRLCCLSNLLLAGKPVQPEQLIHFMEQKNLLIDRAYFFAELALTNKKLNGNYLSDDQVLGSFDQLLGDFSIKKVNFLMQRLIALPEHDCTQESRATFERAWQILASIPTKEERSCYCECILLFLAMKYALPVAGRSVTPDQVWQSILTLRDSFTNWRLQFFFLADCCCTDTALNGLPVSEQQVLDCLKKSSRNRLRDALERWFADLHREPREPDTLNRVLPFIPQGTTHHWQIRQPKLVVVHIKNLHTGGPFPTEVVEYYDDPPDPTLINSQTRKVLGIVRSISGLCLTGSFSRWLQGVGSSFNEIDIMACADSVDTLTARITNQLNKQESEAEIHCKVLTHMVHGCPELLLNPALTITLSEGDLGQKVSVLQASIYPPETISTLNTTMAAIPGEDASIACLAFAAEIELLNNTLQYLAGQLDDLTTQLLREPSFVIPRTILFNCPQHPVERVFGLLMRCLLTLNKAKKFLTLVNDRREQYRPIQQTLQTLTAQLQERVQGHSHQELFVARVTQWLEDCTPSSEYQARECAFIRTLLDMLTPSA